MFINPAKMNTEAAEKYMQRCFYLAQLGVGKVSPNPLVGSVVVQNGRIIGEGFHAGLGRQHAEAMAIADVLAHFPDGQTLLQTSTLYVNLEPCAHTGKTPPCSELIIRMQIPQVVIACLDPNPITAGKGVENLRKAGIVVCTGLLEATGKHLNRRFIAYHTKQRPYIILKWAQTKDCFLAPNQPVKYPISGIESQILVHQWRTEEDAILVGRNTALIDNPALTARKWEGKSPIRLVIDRKLSLPKTLKLFDNSVKTIVFNESETRIVGQVQYIQMEFENYLLQFILYQLYLQDITSVIIEGGAITLQHFLNFNLWDEARVFTAATFLLAGKQAPHLPAQYLTASQPVGVDILQIYHNNPDLKRD